MKVLAHAIRRYLISWRYHPLSNAIALIVAPVALPLGVIVGAATVILLLLTMALVLAARLLAFLIGIARARIAMRADEREFVFLLGSFSRALENERFAPSVVFDMYPRQDLEANLRTERMPDLAVSAFLGTIVDLMPIVRLGGRAEAGVLVLTTDDTMWYEAFLRLADDARAILIVPGLGVSLARELGHAFGTHAEKCVVLQPPISVITESEARDLLKDRFSNEFWEKYGWNVANVPQSSRISAWRELSASVQERIGLELPPHISAGQLLRRADNVWMSFPCTKSGFAAAVQQITPTHRGLSSSLKAAQPLIRRAHILGRATGGLGHPWSSASRSDPTRDIGKPKGTDT